MPDALAVLVGQHRPEHVDHHGPLRQSYFSHSRMTVAKATPFSSESETWADVTPPTSWFSMRSRSVVQAALHELQPMDGPAVDERMLTAARIADDLVHPKEVPLLVDGGQRTDGQQPKQEHRCDGESESGRASDERG